MSISTDEIKRPLMTPDEVARMRGPEKDIDGNITKAGEMLIFQTGKPPIRGTQILHFEDPTFLARSKVPPPEKGDVIK
jgi:type IV secretion system protein VirD4